MELQATSKKDSREKVYERVCKVVKETLQIKNKTISEESRYIDDLGSDSLDQVELIMNLEDEFKSAISEKEAETLTTIGSTVDYILNKMSESGEKLE